MCGICGFTNANLEDYSILRAMCDVIAHRGPDGQGQYVADGVALGHRRLSLIDLEGGSQPMVRLTSEMSSPTLTAAEASAGNSTVTNINSADFFITDGGDYAIVFNGEIYNYCDLKEELASLGFSFSTSSDTEVLLVAYIAWGKKCLQKFRGMFAFAIWDKQKCELFCARDMFGIKPFYYTIQDGRLIFASEIKSILEHPAYKRELNVDALEQYLCFQFSALTETFFKGIYKLEPAHYMTFDTSTGRSIVERWWCPTFNPDTSRQYYQSVDDIDATIHDSVKYHNVADVEVGSFLSSGIDSSYLAATLAQYNPSIQTFTVGFAEYEGERDEISWATELANRLNIKNSHKYITEQEYWEVLRAVQWHMDEPLADPSAVALYFVDQLAATKVKAVLSGEGADEFFSGYKIYQVPLSNKKIDWIPRCIRTLAYKACKSLGIRGANYLERSLETPRDWYYTNANGAAFTPQEREQLLLNATGCMLPLDVVAKAYDESREYDEITQMQYVDILHWMVGDILLKTDKMSMAHSLESRVPFLDKRVFAIAASLPTSQRINDHQTKISLRAASERVLPKDWAQKEKLGFPVPLASWLRKPEHSSKINNAFHGDTASRYFDVNILDNLLANHLSGERDNSRKIWIIYMFLIWHEIYFE